MSNGYPDAAVLLAHSSASWETPPAVLVGADDRLSDEAPADPRWAALSDLELS